MNAPLNHVARPSLPWRGDTGLTECGLRADSYPTVSRSELADQLARLGKQRTALLTCMTCLNTAQRHPSWDEDPARCLDREVNRKWGATPADDPFTLELRALAALVDLHRDEFADLLASVADATPLARRRNQRKVGRR